MLASMAKSLHALLALSVYPAVLGGACLLWTVLWHGGLDATLAALGTQLSAALVIFCLERQLPHARKWQEPHGDADTDALHLGVSLAISAGVLRLLRAFAPPLLAAQLSPLCGPPVLSGAASPSLLFRLWPALAPLGSSPQPPILSWPHALPLPLQLVLALVLAELGGYLSHRLLHRLPGLWPFHAVHHSAQRLYFINASRNHPIDMAFTVFATFLPLVLFGMGETAFALFSVFTSTHLLLQHSNIAQRTGPLNWILATADVHRWHHSRKRAEADANYGQVLLIWDVIFGTRRVPSHRSPPIAVGFEGDETYPHSYLDQLREPFRHLAARGQSR